MYQDIIADAYIDILFEADDIDEKTAKDLDAKLGADDSKSMTDKMSEKASQKKISKDIHDNNPVIDYFKSTRVKLTNFGQIKALGSKETGALTKIGYVISTIALYILSSISFSKSILEKMQVKESYLMNSNITDHLLSLQPETIILEDDRKSLLAKASTSIKILYYSKKIIHSMTNILVKMYGGATQILYVMSNISLAVISVIFFTIGTFLIKEDDKTKPIFDDLSQRTISILSNKGNQAFGPKTDKKYELIKKYAKLCFSFVGSMLAYLPVSLKETVRSAWNIIKNLPNMIKNFFNVQKNSFSVASKDVYKEEILKEFFNPLNIVGFVFNKLKNMPKVMFVLAAGVLIIVLATKKSSVKLPDFIKNPLNSLVQKSKEIVGKFFNKDNKNTDTQKQLNTAAAN